MKLYSVYRILVKYRRLKWLLRSLVLFALLGCLGYQAYSFIDREFVVAEELPFYDIGPRPDDDTLRVAIIGDSWAALHMALKCDTMFELYGRRWTQKPVKCITRGKNGAMSKDVYYYMFKSQIQEQAFTRDNCTQPLLEELPDYCVVMVGINDTWKKRPVSYYSGNYRLIIRLLLHNHIRPVVMEIPDFEMGEWLDANRKRQRRLYRIYSYCTGVVADDITPFRNGLKKMLEDTGLGDSVLFIPANHWIPDDHQYSEDIYQIDHVHLNRQGYHLLDSCIASEIINDCQKKR